MNLTELRTYNPNHRPRNMTNYYCPLCDCRKSGWEGEPNSRDEGCGDYDCPCHEEDPEPDVCGLCGVRSPAPGMTACVTCGGAGR